MEEARFITDTPLYIRVMPSCLVITAKPWQQVLAFLQGVTAKAVLEKV